MTFLLHNLDFLWGLFMSFLTIIIICNIYYFVKKVNKIEKTLIRALVKQKYTDIIIAKYRFYNRGSNCIVLAKDDFLFNDFEYGIIQDYERELIEIEESLRGNGNLIFNQM